MSFEPVHPKAVESYLADEIKRIRSELSRDDDVLRPEVVHKARVATRRLKAALDLVEPLVSEELFDTMAKAAKKLRRRLGAIREIDVNLTMLGGSAKDGSIALLREDFEDERKAAQERMSPAKRRRLLKEVRLTRQAKKELAALRPAVEALIKDQVLKEFAPLLESADRAAGAKTPTDLHTLRVAAKRFRYQLEIAEAAGFKVAGSAGKHFKRIQDALGEWHDEVILAKSIAAFAGDSAHFETAPDVAEALIELTRARLKRSNASLRQFQQLWKSTRAELVAAVAQIETGTVIQSEKGRGRAKKA